MTTETEKAIEITPEMIAAGVLVLRSYNWESALTQEEAVSEILKAALLANRQEKP